MPPSDHGRESRRLERHIKRVAGHRKDCSFDEFAALLMAAGFTPRRRRGTSHIIFERNGQHLSVPFARPIGIPYVDDALTAARAVLETLHEQDQQS